MRQLLLKLKSCFSRSPNEVRDSEYKDLPLVGYESKDMVSVPVVEVLSDSDLMLLNGLMPWAAFICDSRGRRFGNWHNPTKRAEPQAIPDKRIADFWKNYGQPGATCLELGCFEGIHSAALSMLGAKVTAVDARIEHVCKTLVRCGLMHTPITVDLWDVETEVPRRLQREFAFLCHIGVLYHLKDPVAHLSRVLPLITSGVLLDTHVAPKELNTEDYISCGKKWKYYRFREGGRDAPFAGLYDHAKWLSLSDLLEILEGNGLSVRLVNERIERNGPRVLIHATRTE